LLVILGLSSILFLAIDSITNHKSALLSFILTIVIIYGLFVFMEKGKVRDIERHGVYNHNKIQ